METKCLQVQMKTIKVNKQPNQNVTFKFLGGFDVLNGFN